VGTALAYRYAAQAVNAACASVPQTAPMPTGSASLMGATTVCCP
jgi:hypothetical protein